MSPLKRNEKIMRESHELRDHDTLAKDLTDQSE